LDAAQTRNSFAVVCGTGARRVKKATRGKSAANMPERDNVNLAALIGSIGNRDERAEHSMRELHDLTVGKLMGLARGMLRNSADAEEIVCDTYVQVWQSARKFDEIRGSAIAWLVMICRSRALDRIRERKLRAALAANESAELVVVSDDEQETLLSMLQTDSLVRSALATLSIDKRRLVELAFLEGLSHADLSARTGVPLGTVKSTLRRSLQTLHASLDGVAL
jgi:RNA polymerase sigma-70 factor (ECF subfamily)